MHAHPTTEAPPLSSRERPSRDELTRRLLESSQSCAAIAEACLARLDARLMQCARLATDCSDILVVTARVAARRTGSNEAVVVGLLMLSEALCRDCADAFEQQDEQRQLFVDCAASCRRCEAACRDAREHRVVSVVQ